MKKLILSVFAVVAMACCFSACNSGTGCYLVTVTIEIPGAGSSEQAFYYYGSNEDIDAYASEQGSKLAGAAVVGAKVTTSYIKVPLAESDCKTVASVTE